MFGGDNNPLVVGCDGDHSEAIFESGDPHGGNAVGGDYVEYSATRLIGELDAFEEGLATIGRTMPNRAVEDAGASDGDLQQRILQVLSDGARIGAPAKFSAEQIAGLIALACELPADSDLPVSHWTPPELAREAVRRGLVESISARQVDRFLAQRTCDRTRANTGSPRRTNEKTPSNTRSMSKRCVRCVDKLHSLQGKARTW